MEEIIINNPTELEQLRDKLELETGNSIIFRYDESFDEDDSYPVFCKKQGKNYLIYKKK